MGKKIKLSFIIVVLSALIILTVPAAGYPSAPSDDIELAYVDIYQTGTPAFDLVCESYYEFESLNVRNMSPLVAGVAVRPDGYYWVMLKEEDWDAVRHVVDELQHMMGEDFPIAVSVISPDGKTTDGIEWSKINDIHRAGSPDYDLVREFAAEFSVSNLKYASGDSPIIVGAFPRQDGYYWLIIREENRDAINHTVDELQHMMGEDFPIAVTVGQLDLLADDVFGGHKCVIQRYFLHQPQSLGFAGFYFGENRGEEFLGIDDNPWDEFLGMVLSGHWINMPPPVGTRVYSPRSYYPFRTYQIGIIDHVGGELSDTSWMKAAYEGFDRIQPGIEHYGTHGSVWGWLEPPLGFPVYKTGFRTGTTHGELVLYGLIWHPQHETWLVVGASDFDADHGDSGCPVYVVGDEYALLSGTLIGEFTFGQQPLRVFSPISLILDELNVDIWIGP